MSLRPRCNRQGFPVDEERVLIGFRLNADQIRFILSYAEGRLRGGSPAGGRNRGGPTKKGP